MYGHVCIRPAYIPFIYGAYTHSGQQQQQQRHTHIKFNILFNPLNVFANLSFNSHYTNFTIKNMFLIHMPCVTANIYRQNYNLYFDFQQPICEKPMPKNKTIIYRDSYRLTNLFAYSCVHVEYTIIISCVEVILCEVQVSLHDLAL